MRRDSSVNSWAPARNTSDLGAKALRVRNAYRRRVYHLSIPRRVRLRTARKLRQKSDDILTPKDGFPDGLSYLASSPF
jgi:hypothetical protein